MMRGLMLISVLAAMALLAARASTRDSDASHPCSGSYAWGDTWDVNRGVGADDAQEILRIVADYHQHGTYCTATDIDCDGAVTSVDALKILRYVAGLSYAQVEPCPDIGTKLGP